MPVKDTLLLKIYLDIGFFLGIIPSLSKNDTRRKTLLFHVYIFLLFVLFVVTSILLYTERYHVVKGIMVLTQKIVDFVQVLMELLFITTSLLGAIVLKQSWKTVLDKIAIVDRKLKTDIQNVSICYCLKGVIYFLIFLSCEIYEIFAWEKFRSGIEVYYTVYRIIKFYQFFVLMLFSEIVHLLNRRYLYLDALIKSTFVKGVNITYMKANLREIRTLCILLSEVSQKISDIFGKQIVVILGSCIILILNLCNWTAIALAEDMQEISKIEILVCSGFIDPFSYIIIITIAVLNCDALEKIGQDIMKTCYFLQQHIDMEYSVLRGELIILSNFFRELAPKISACGYFDVNKKLLTSLFSAITSYIVIIIQFRNSS